MQALLELLFALSTSEERAARVAGLVPGLLLRSRAVGSEWRSGEHRVRYYGQPEEPLNAAWFGCSCPDWPGPPCDHIAAVLVLLAWRADGGRRWFQAPLWELALGRVLAVAAPAPSAPAAQPAHAGWIRYTLHPPEPGGSWGFGRQLVRVSRRGPGELRPQPCPDRWEAVVERVRGLGEGDRRFHAAWEGWSELRRLYEGRWTAIPERGQRLLAELEDRMVRSLTHARELWVGERRARVSEDPLRPGLVAEAAPDGGLILRWDPPQVQRVALGSGWVLDHTDTLRPLAAEVQGPLLGLLGRPLPPVAPDEVQTFLLRGVQSGRLPLTLAQPEALGAVEPDQREARLALGEEGDELVVDLLVAYTADGVEHPVSPRPALPLVPLAGEDGGPRWLVRDLCWEAEALEAAAEALGVPLPARFAGEDALRVLTEQVPELARRWPIWGQERLTRARVRGTLAPRTRLGEGLGVQVDFTLDGLTLESAAVLDAWAQGRPWLRLPDGALARLPEAWLNRHGAAVAELEELRRAQAPELVALPVVAELLEAAEQSPAAGGGPAPEDPAAGEPAPAQPAPSPWREVLGRLEGRSALPEDPPPPGLNAALRPYQLQGYRWLRGRGALGLGAVLADDMGLGKTVQALALLLDRGGPALVVAPTSAVYAWADEARRFAPGLKVRVHHGPGRDTALPGDAQLVLTTYSLLRLDQERLAAPAWRTVVLDEAQNIRNPSSAVSQAARSLRAGMRVALTGTPFENHLHELRSLFEFVIPGFFGSRRAFAARYATPIERQQDPESLARLRRRIGPFVLRRLKGEVAPELPPLQQAVLRVELPAEQRALYEAVRLRCHAAVRDQVHTLGLERAALHVLEALTRLRQACCHPALLPWPEARAVRGSAKLDALEEGLEAAIGGGHRSLVFSQWPTLLERVSERLRERGWEHLTLTGATRGRQALVDRFNTPDGPPVFLISLKAGGTALNLTGADHVFHLDPWWNPAAEAQATDRAHRIGQLRRVTAWRLVARDTVEERILALQDRKRAVFQAALEPNADASPWSLDELRAVLEELEQGSAPG